MANCLTIVVNNNMNVITFCDIYNKYIELHVSINSAANVIENGLAQEFYNTYYSDCDSVTLYNKDTYVCCLENEIDFNLIAITDIEALSL